MQSESFSKCPVPFFNVIIQPISSCLKHKTMLTSPSTSISHPWVTITVFSSPLSLVHSRYHLFIQSIQPAGFSKSLFILCSFFLDSLPLLTILFKMPQTGKSVADSKLGCVQQKISLTCLSSCAGLYISAKRRNMGQQVEIIDISYRADSL